MPDKDEKSIREKHEDISHCYTKYWDHRNLVDEVDDFLSLKVADIPKSLKKSLSNTLEGEYYPGGKCYYLSENERELHRQDAEEWLSKLRQKVRDYVAEKIPNFKERFYAFWGDTTMSYSREYSLIKVMHDDMQKKQKEHIKEYYEIIGKAKSEKQNTNDKSSETELEREAREYGETHIIGFPYQKDRRKEWKMCQINKKYISIKKMEAIVKQWERDVAKEREAAKRRKIEMERRNSTKKNINKSGTNTVSTNGTNKDKTNVTKIVDLLLDTSNKLEKKTENAKKLLNIIFGDNLKSSLLKGKKDLFVENIMETAQAARVAFTKFEKNMKKLGKNIMQNNVAVKQLVRDFVTKVRQRWNQCIKDIKVGLEATQGKWTKHIRNQDEDSQGLHRG